MTTFVYPYLKQQAEWNELEYSIRSVKKYFQGKSDIWVIGDKPSLRGVNFIPSPRINCVRGREFDVYHKLQIVMDDKRIPNEFVWMYDDTFFLQNIELEFLQQVIAYDYIYDIDKYIKRGKVSIAYRSRFRATYDRLVKLKLPLWDYETHLPRWYAKDKLQQIFNRHHLHERLYLLSTLYFNTFYKAPETTVRRDPTIKAELYSTLSGEKLLKALKGKKILNYWNPALNKDFKNLLRSKLV